MTRRGESALCGNNSTLLDQRGLGTIGASLWLLMTVGPLPITPDPCSLERHGGTWFLQKLSHVGHNQEVSSSHERASQSGS